MLKIWSKWFGIWYKACLFASFTRHVQVESITAYFSMFCFKYLKRKVGKGPFQTNLQIFFNFWLYLETVYVVQPIFHHFLSNLNINKIDVNQLLVFNCKPLKMFSIFEMNFQLFDYERLVNILLFIVSEHKGEENNFVQRAGICLLNSLACQVTSSSICTQMGNL